MKVEKKILFLFGYTIFLIASLSFFTCKQKQLLDITPTQYFENMVNKPFQKLHYTGEGYCWQARVGMDRFIEYYELTGDTEWLDAGIKYYDHLLNKRETDPDGYKGWIGPYGYDKNYWQDALVGDAILFTSILDFSVLVMEDEKLKAQYQDKALSYVATAKRDLIEKWDHRGCWYVDGPYGGYLGFGRYFKPGESKEWVDAPTVERSGLSHPFNKQMDVAEVCLRIHRITGEKKYWDIAEKIYYTVKSRFQYFDDHYCWNYWEPLYPGDVDFEKNQTLHWVGVHMWRSGYQAGEVGKIVEAYHYGIVFDKQDIQRIIHTNLDVMWNKDRENPVFINSNGLGAEHDTTGRTQWRKVYGHSNDFINQGQLWTSLLDFDQTIRDLYELRFKDDKDSPQYQTYKNRVLANPPGFDRKHSENEVTVPKVHFTESKDLYLAAVLPHKVPTDGQSILICNSWNSGELMIDLVTTAGEKVANLFKGDIRQGLFMMKWDGKDPDGKKQYSGDYYIRYTINGGYRETPVVI
ncbi:MAG: hypothetical protein PHS40_01895 [Mariniphaga sp.]|nr:hypothetical protein [Mariniphaga sp.]MDD4424658.1 hypothetical protein [Mariniphaga sp.]